MTRARLAALLVATFILGAVAGPWLTVERRTLLVDGSQGDRPAVQRLLSAGWTVRQTDAAMLNARLVTLERSRLAGVSELAGAWLAWASGTGAYARR